MEQTPTITTTDDISHPVRDAFQELRHQASVAATSGYVALPILMASSLAYGHETGEAHEPNPTIPIFLAGIAAGLFLGEVSNWADQNRVHRQQERGYFTSL